MSRYLVVPSFSDWGWRVSTALVWLTTRSATKKFTTVRGMATSRPANRLIVDTDVGFDDLMALQTLIRSRCSVTAPPIIITTVGGVISAPRGSRVLAGLFPANNPVAVGLQSPVMPYDPVPAWLVDYRTRTLDLFAKEMNLPTMAEQLVENNMEEHDNNSARSRAVSAILDAPGDEGVDILCIGPLTNLSNWLSHCESKHTIGSKKFASKIRAIYILGGNDPSLANTLEQPEFNFGIDPLAAQHVLMSPVLQDKVHLVPSSVCNMDLLYEQVGEERIKAFIADLGKSSSPKFYQTLVKYDGAAYCLSCDPVCAFAMEHPGSVSWRTVSISVEPTTGKVLPAKAKGTVDLEEACASVRMAVAINLVEYLSWVRGAALTF